MFYSVYDFPEFNNYKGHIDKGNKKIASALRKRLGREATKQELFEARRQLNLDIRLRNKNNVVEAFNKKLATLDRQNRSNNRGVILNAVGINDYYEINGISAEKARSLMKVINNLTNPKTTRSLLKKINKQQALNRKAGNEAFDEINTNLSLDVVINTNLSLFGPSIENDWAAENVVDLRYASSLRSELKAGNVSPERLEEIIRELEEIKFTTEAPDWVQDTLKAAKGMRMGHDFSTADMLYGHTKQDRDLNSDKPKKERKIKLTW